VPARRTGTLDHAGERIYFESVGDGPAVVLTHGLGGNHAVWWRQVGVLAAGRRVVTWDQRGFGGSTRRTGPVGPEPAVGDLAALLDHLGIDRAHIVGQSMGGWVAMGLAISHPDRVRSLVLADSPAGVRTDEVRAAAHEARAGLRRDAGFGRHPALGDRFCAEHPDEAALYELIGSFGDKPPDAEMIELLSACRWPLGAVARVAVPVLLVCGEHDPMAPPAGMRAVAAVLRDARVEVIPGCGHSPYFEAPEAWNAVVARFLDEVG
jgi:3-oxoadipate enol-lactonase